MKKALITGITGQDGAYLSEFLLKKGYEVHGIKRRSSLFKTERVDHLYEDPHVANRRFILHYGDLSDATNIIRIVQEVQPNEIYNLGAMSHVKVSFDTPEYVIDVDGVGVLRILEAVRLLGLSQKTKIYQASTSELYGKVVETPQNETTPFYPRSPYAVAKLYAYWIMVNYREAYGMFACNGILFNHESPLRGETFVTRKITRAAAKMALGLQQKLFLGNLDAERDWGHAKDYVKAMWQILQYEQAEDWVIATGVTTTVRSFVKLAFQELGMYLVFKGAGIAEVGILDKIDAALFLDKVGHLCPFAQGDILIKVDSNYFRPSETDTLRGDASKAKQKLNWQPQFDVKDLVREMVQADMELFKRNRLLKQAGFNIKNEFE